MQEPFLVGLVQACPAPWLSPLGLTTPSPLPGLLLCLSLTEVFRSGNRRAPGWCQKVEAPAVCGEAPASAVQRDLALTV